MANLASQKGGVESDTRTKTAYFSHNECSEEVIMVSSQHRQLWAGQKVKNTEVALQVGAEESAQEPLGFERGRVNQKNLKEKQVMLEIEGPQTKGSKHASLDSSGCEANDQARAVRRP